MPDGVGPYEIHLNAMSPADVLAAFTQSFHIGHHYIGFFLLFKLLVLFFFVLVLSLFVNFALFKAHVGYLQLLRALLR